jgi:ferritin
MNTLEKEVRTEKVISRLVKEVSNNRAKIIDSFLEMFVASRLEWFKEKPERLRRIKLVEQRSNDGLRITYSIEMKRGKLKNGLIKI